MVGRTPEFLGKKIEAREVKLVLVGVLVTPLLVLLGTSLAVASHYGTMSIYNPGPAGLLRVALRLHVAGQQQRLGLRRLHRLHPAQRPGNAGAYGITFADLLGGLAMMFARFLPMLAALAVGRRAWPARKSPRRRRHLPRRLADLRRPADRRRRDRRRPDLLPRLPARPRRAGPDRPALLMNGLRKDLITATIAIVFLTLVLGVAYPLLTTGVIAQVLFPARPTAARSKSTASSSARS